MEWIEHMWLIRSAGAAFMVASILALTSVTSAAAEPRTCTELEKRSGVCGPSGYIEGNEAVVENGEGSASNSSSSNGSGGGRGNSAGTGTGSGSGAAAPPPCTADLVSNAPGCDHHDTYTVTVITLADIARFRPTPGIQRMEPDGWVVVGLPANIYSVVDRQVVPGELLGESADVRFTPVGWRWDYGDGSTATLPTKGGTWAGLGLREFDATPTSHVYRRSGEYTIRLSIVYRAEYRISGGAFVPIAGTLTLPANELHITAGGAKTVLVDRDCTVAPRGPGC